MARLVVPLKYRTLYATGDVLLRGELDLLLQDQNGNWRRETFLVDWGSEMSTMPAYKAKKLDLPIPSQAARGVRHEQTGLAIRSGYLRAQVVGLDQTEYVWPCFFLGDPNTPPHPNAPRATLPRNLLGFPGVINQLRIYGDGDSGPNAPHGNLIVEKK